MPTELHDLSVTKVALCGRGMNPDAEVLLFKSKAGEPPVAQEATVAAITKEDHDAVVAERDAFKAELDALTVMSNEDLAALKGFEIAKADPKPDEVLKSLPAEVRERIEKAEADAKANADRIAKMEQENRTRDFVRKARDEFGDLAPAEELGAVLEAVDRVLPEEAKQLDSILKAVAARADTSALFKELGNSGTAADDDPVAKIKAQVAEIRKANPDMSASDATARALRENPDLADAWSDRK